MLPHTARQKFHAGRPVLDDHRCRWLCLSAIEALVFHLIQEDEIRAIADRTAYIRLRRHERLEHVNRNLGAASLAAQERQPRQLLLGRRAPQMHVPRPEIGGREQAETRLDRDPQVRVER
jgi:gluconate kinase